MRLVGDAAKNNVIPNPDNTLFAFKRFIGRTFDDPHVQVDKQLLPYKIVNVSNTPSFELDFATGTRRFCPEEVSAMLLSYLRKTAETYLGVKVTTAVISVPANFNDAQVRVLQAQGKSSRESQDATLPPPLMLTLTGSARQHVMPGALPVSTSSASSMSQPLLRWLSVSISRGATSSEESSSLTLVGAPWT